MDKNLPTFRRRNTQQPAAPTPSAKADQLAVKRVRELPGYEDHSAQAAVEPATHLVNLVEDKNWYTPGMWLTAYIATAALILGVGGAVVAIGGLWLGSLGINLNLYMSIALTILVAFWIVGTLVFVNTPQWLVRIPILGRSLRFLHLVHRAGSGADAREKARVLGDSLLIIAAVSTLGAVLVWIPIYKLILKPLFKLFRGGDDSKIYQKERDIRT